MWVLWADSKGLGLLGLLWCKLAGHPPPCQPPASSPLLPLPPHPPVHSPEVCPGMTKLCRQTWFQNRVSGEGAFLLLLLFFFNAQIRADAISAAFYFRRLGIFLLVAVDFQSYWPVPHFSGGKKQPNYGDFVSL